MGYFTDSIADSVFCTECANKQDEEGGMHRLSLSTGRCVVIELSEHNREISSHLTPSVCSVMLHHSATKRSNTGANS